MNNVLEIIRNPSYDLKKIFTDDKERFTQVKTAFENINGSLPRDKCILFLTEKITPTIFDKSINNTTRDQAIEIGFALLNYVNVTHLSHGEINNFLTTIEEKYVVVIGELRDDNYANWDKLWIFLIKLCHRKINHKLTLTNKILRTIEVAFRNSTSIDHRVKAYDCWIEWINLCSLNMQYMCSPKQLRLLITPMKAKFSRMPVIIQKRCETFVYLLEKLEDKATLCLKEFLEFCFGPFDENKQSEGKNVAGVFQMGTKVLIASIGHNHLNQKCISIADMKFKNSLINASNFANFCEVLINSVVECCILLNEWETGSSAIEKTVMQCLWRSLRVLIEESNTETKHTCFTQLENTLKLLQKRIANDQFCTLVLGNVIEVMIEPPVHENLKEHILNYSLYLLNRNPKDNLTTDKLVEFILECLKSETYAKTVCDYFQLNVKFENNKLFGEIWIKNRYYEDFSKNVDLSYLIWPIKNCNDFENKKDLYDKWFKLYSNGCKTEKFKLIIIQEIDKLFQENPLLSSNVVSFLKLISEPSSKDNELVGKYIKLIASLSTLPNLDDNSKQTLSTIILTYFDQNLPIFGDINNNESIKKLCEALENIVNVHKDYKILSKLTKKLSESPSKSLSKFSKEVMPILENLMLNDDTNVLNDSRRLIELFESKENEPETKPASSSSRTMRMLNMANPSTPTNSLKFFGKHAETSTPLNAKSGNLQKTTPQNSVKKYTAESSGRKRKFNAALANDESNSSDYVKISTEVKFEPSKLSEHQKEVLKKRREDIPALYEDLSQSQTSNMSSDSNAKAAKNGLEKVENEKSAEQVGNEQKKTDTLAKSSKDNSETDKTKALRKSTRQTFKQIKFTTDEFFVTPLKKQKLSEEGGKKVEENAEKTGEKSDSDEKKPKRRHSSAKNEAEKLQKEKRKSSSKKIDDFLVENQAQGSKAESSRRKSSSSKPAEEKSEESKPIEEIKPEEKVQKDKQNSVAEKDSKPENSRRKSLNSKQTPSNQSPKSDEEVKPEEKVQREKRISVAENQDSKPENSRRKSLNAKQTNQPPKSEESEKSKAIEEEEKVQKEKQNSVAEKDSKPENSRRKSLISKQAPSNQPPKSDASEKSKATEETKPEEKVQREKRKSSSKKVDDSAAESRKSSSSKPAETTQSSKTDEETKPEEEEEDKKSVSEEESAKKPNSSKLLSSKQAETSPETPDIIENSESQTSSRRRSLFKQIETVRDSIKNFLETKPDSPPPPKSKISITSSTEELQKTLMEDLSFSLSDETDKNSAETEKQDESSEAKTKKRKPKVFRGARNLRARKTNKEESFQHVTADTSPTFLATRNLSVPESDSVIVVNDSTVIELDSITEPKSEEPLLESEDIIESSQDKRETCQEDDVIIPPMKTLSVKLSQLPCMSPSKQSEETSPEDRKAPRRSPRSSPRLKKTSPDHSPPLADTESVIIVASEELPETESCEVVQSVNVTRDVPEMTLRSECLTPILQQKSGSDDLPSSPVTFDTPDRTVELLNNTSDISPINQGLSESATPVNAAKQKRTGELKPYLRVARLLQMANPGVSVGSPSGASWGGLQCSPSRTKRMKMKKGEELQVLTFSREIPSPLVVPSSGILKRKICGDEAVLPCPKRKRVNFSDPAITEKKVFIKDSEEYSESNEVMLMNGADEETLEPTEKVIQLDDLDKLLESELEREEMFPIIKALCELKFKSLNVDNAKFQTIFKTISEDSGVVPEIVDSISNYLEKKDESEECRLLFLNHLYVTLDELATEKIEAFIKRLVEVFNLEKDESKVSIENIFDDESIMSKVKDYVESLFDDDERNQFLVKLMQFASSNLPVQKQFLQNHLDLVQSFVVRMD